MNSIECYGTWSWYHRFGVSIGGACAVGIESTIVDLSRGRAVLLRPGQITPAQIAAVIGAEVAPPKREV